MLFFSRSKSKLGVDIGTSTIKIVQLRPQEDKFKLETYGSVNVSRQLSNRSRSDIIAQTADIIRTLLKKSGTTTKKVVASLPNNIVFISVIDMPPMTDKELKGAIEWEARRYVPLPLEEVTLSWSALREKNAESKIKVLITAVPTTVINNYMKMFKMAGLEPEALEIEALALIRSLVGARRDSFIIVDIGARNTSLNLVDNGFLRISRNLSIGGDTITNGVAKSLKISTDRAEQFKVDLGLSQDLQQIPEVMKNVIDEIKNEVSQLIKIYESRGGAIGEVILTGSGSLLPGLAGYFDTLGVKTTLGNSMRAIDFDRRLEPDLKKISHGLAVAMGLAMRQ